MIQFNDVYLKTTISHHSVLIKVIYNIKTMHIYHIKNVNVLCQEWQIMTSRTHIYIYIPALQTYGLMGSHFLWRWEKWLDTPFLI